MQELRRRASGDPVAVIGTKRKPLGAVTCATKNVCSAGYDIVTLSFASYLVNERHISKLVLNPQ
ncbi:hypothetical protein TELCIR_16097, partial [Teladorsagia circumcincta]